MFQRMLVILFILALNNGGHAVIVPSASPVQEEEKPPARFMVVAQIVSDKGDGEEPMVGPQEGVIAEAQAEPAAAVPAAPQLTEWGTLGYGNMNDLYREEYGVDLTDGCGVLEGKPYPLHRVNGRPNTLCQVLEQLCGQRNYLPGQIHTHAAVNIAEQSGVLGLDGRDPGDAGRQLRHMAATAERQGIGRDAFRDLMCRLGWPVVEKDSRQGFKKKKILDF